MRDFPVFTTEYGVASLVLREIPYQQAAYVTLQSTQEPDKLLEECVSFCRACGAEAVYAKGHPWLEQYPLYTAMWELRCPVDAIDDTDAALWPVQEQTVQKWQQIYNEKVNKLYKNIIWSQRGNYLDVPMDCPQRDERMGWTGDAEVFCKTASYNYDVEKFFLKWLGDLRADQTGWGTIPHVIPDTFGVDNDCSAAWADAATICPWQLYLTYANKDILKESLKCMKNYLEHIEEFSDDVKTAVRVLLRMEK